MSRENVELVRRIHAAWGHGRFEPRRNRTRIDGSSAGRRRRAVLSLVTIAWLTAQLWVIFDLNRETWPVMEASFFSWSAEEDQDVELRGTTRDGRTIPMSPRGFGLESPQLHTWLSKRVGPALSGNDTLATLARIWNARHPREKVVTVELLVRSTPLRADADPSTGRVLTWSAQ
jgi:hypothetical protein